MAMYLKSIELLGFKSFGKKEKLVFTSSIASIVGPNGSGKSNVAEAFRFVLGEQSMKSLRSKKGEDLIWGGSPALARANRASVKVVFDNSKRLLDIDFPEVMIERVVHRDGANEYLLNGTQVRLKDVIRLLAGANIGGSGYQIISQGEADRILNASPKERREMVEDALGLKLYQHKKAESERKLEETAVNIDKTKSLRREIGPHLHFLRMQVERLEKARELREELAHQINDYLAREHAWITQEDARLLDEARVYDTQIRDAGRALEDARARRTGGNDAVVSEIQSKLRGAEHALAQVRQEGERVSRELGRAEGALEAVSVTVTESISASSARDFAREIEEALDDAEDTEDLSEVRLVLERVRDRIRSFIEGFADKVHKPDTAHTQHVVDLSAQLAQIQKQETAATAELEMLRQELSRARESGFVAERDVIALEAQLREAQSKLSMVQNSRAAVAVARERFEEEVREGIALIGAAVHGWQRSEIPQGSLSEDRSVQERRRRAMERLKIKIEEAGIGNSDAVVKEFNQTKQRDEFLTKELVDLETSAASLRDIIAELEKTIDQRFTEGLKHINVALGEFFSKLFGGGEAKLTVETPRKAREARHGAGPADLDDEDLGETIPEEESLYAGLSISVSLPRKKVRGLEVLSGGERALTSIALIFSMSQVNPPPFLILDETDAALDEANSKRYADMIRILGAHSQLIVITHNRATMAAAGELYGVTMSSDGVSKLLSVKLAEAEKVAK
ncbi:AAA family ATPase [Candidatus Kaiserbacteria bacterium]|nr:AAA family ATPase [Candidatus Kaiserbacteria bacterium]